MCTHNTLGCESLLDDFDPLRLQPTPPQPTPPQPIPSQPIPSQPQQLQQTMESIDSTSVPREDEVTCELPPRIIELSITEASPGSSPILAARRSSNPFRVSGDFSNINPFDDSFNPFPPTPTTDLLYQSNGSPTHDIRHCTSETNLSKLKKEYQPLRTLGEVEPLVTRSEEDLLSSSAENRHCMVDVDTHRHLNGGLGSPQRSSGSQEAINDPLDYKSRRARSTENSPTQYRKILKQASIESKQLDSVHRHSKCCTHSLK